MVEMLFDQGIADVHDRAAGDPADRPGGGYTWSNATSTDRMVW